MVRKTHDNTVYAGAVYEYARELAVSIRDLVSFICTDDKHKISVGEPGFPITALPRRPRVLVGKNEVFKAADHNFLCLSLIPTLILIQISMKAMYTDRGPEHCTTFFSVKTEIITLQKFLNHDHILVAKKSLYIHIVIQQKRLIAY